MSSYTGPSPGRQQCPWRRAAPRCAVPSAWPPAPCLSIPRDGVFCCFLCHQPSQIPASEIPVSLPCSLIFSVGWGQCAIPTGLSMAQMQENHRGCPTNRSLETGNGSKCAQRTLTLASALTPPLSKLNLLARLSSGLSMKVPRQNQNHLHLP